MSFFKIYLFFILFSASTVISYSQTKLSKNPPNNIREKIEWLTTNAKEYRDSDTAKALQYLEHAELLSKQFNYPDLLSITYSAYAFYYDKDNDPSRMRIYAAKALQAAQRSNDNRALGYAYIQYAYSKGINGNEFINYLLKAEYYLLKTNDYRKISSLYYILAGQYGDLLDMQKQYKYGQAGLVYAQSAHDTLSYAKSLFQIANAQHGLYEKYPDKYTSSYVSALNNYKTVLSVLRKNNIGSKLLNKTIFNVGSLYYEIKNYKNIDSAKYYYLQSKQLSNPTVETTFFLLSRIMLAKIYLEENNTIGSEKQLAEIQEEFPGEHIDDIQIRSNYYLILAGVNENKKEYSTAYIYLSKHKQLSDSLYSFDRVEEIKKIEATYTNLKNTETIKRLQAEQANRKLIIGIVSALLLFSMATIFLLARVNEIGKKKFSWKKSY